MSASPSRIPSEVVPVGVVSSLLSVANKPPKGGISSHSSEHHDSGIDNGHSSDASNCWRTATTDHDREEDATTATTLTTTTTHRDMEDSSSGSENDVDDDDDDGTEASNLRNALPADELADYEIVQSPEEVKVNEEETRPPASVGTGTPAAPSVGAQQQQQSLTRLDNGNSNKVATSKEEKQRQNEEIIILESSSVSSETGSWESVSPEQLQQIHHQQQQVAGNLSDLTVVASCSSVAKLCADHDSKPIRTACFIDASSLLDDSELAERASTAQRTATKLPPDTDTMEEPPPRKVTEIRDQFSSGEFTPLQLSSGGGGLVGSMSNSGSSGECVVSGGGRKSSTPPRGSMAMDPKESEKFQGNIVFKNSINQYSGVLIEDPASTDGVSGGGPSNESECLTTRSYPLRNARSDFNSLMDIYQENKKSASGGFKFNYMRTQSENHAEPQSIILPDTPHNSILNVNLIQSCDVQRGRLRSSDGEEQAPSESSEGHRTPRKHLKFMESAPIVSGGVSVADFSPKLCESPPVRRKLDTCPILSGGYVSDCAEGAVEHPAKVVARPTESSSFKSWVIDLNDLPQAEAEQQTTTTTEEKQTNQATFKNTSQSVPTQKYSHFYVSLDDVPQSPSETIKRGGTDNESSSSASSKVPQPLSASVATTSMKKSTGFFVDFTADSEDAQKKPKEKPTVDGQEKEAGGDESQEEDKNNMFSMFIDFGERKPVPKKESLSFTSRLSETINRRKELERRSESPRSTAERLSSDEGVEKCTSLPFVPLLDRRSDDVQLRPKFRASVSEDQRHTWADKHGASVAAATHSSSAAERPISFTAGDKGLMSIIDKIPLLSKTSSMSIDSSISPMEDFTCSKSELSTFSTSATSNSNNSSTKELNRQLQVLGGSAEKRHLKDAKINETFDKSSQSSITDGVLSKDLSPDSATATNTEDLTYQNEAECLPVECVDVLSEAVVGKLKPLVEVGLSTILETNEKLASPAHKRMGKGAVAVVIKEEEEEAQGQQEKAAMSGPEATHTMETLQATIEKQRKLLLETVNEAAETTSFVRLSDMDKPFQSFEIYSSGSVVGMGSASLTKSGGDRRTRSMAGHDAMGGRGSYYEKTRHNNMYYSTDTNIINLASSFENSRSLSRIFPHLSKVFSSSLPANVGLENLPSEMTSMSSDLSANSSVTSSCNRSVQDSGDDSSIFCRQPKRLGEDLLKMFLHEIGTDVTIDIGGHRRLKAHKCILQSRCQYFAAILAGGWVHNAGNQISLPGYSYDAVHFALCHIYSGAANPPEGISLMELAAIADLLGLVGLREVTEYALKVNYCHNFHKPCLGCIEGILQVLPVALNHGLDDLYRKCLKWTCKHYLKIWPTRTFASLSSDLRHRCQQQIIAHLSAENVLSRILECENLLAVVAPLRWGAAVENILHEISDTAQIYLAEHFASLVASDSFLSLGHDQSCHIPALENLLLRSASTLSPDQACRSYQRVTKLHQVLHSKILTQQQNKIRALVAVDVDAELDWAVEFIRLVSGILSAVEQCLQRQCSRAMRTSAWQRLDLDLRKKIQKLACLTDPLFERRQRANARQQQQQQKTPVYQASYNRNQDIQQVRLAIHAHSKRSAQGYIIDQFTNNHNNNNNHSATGGGRAGHGQYKSHSTTHTQTHLNNHEGGRGGNYNNGKERDKDKRQDKSVQAASHEIGTRSGHITNGAAKLEKSKSHSHVNGSSTAAAMVHTGRGGRGLMAQGKGATALQRNASTSHVVVSSSTNGGGAPNRLRTDVKSRYMESKPSHRTAQPPNDAVRSIRQTDQYSSSGTSTRTASPAAHRKATAAVSGAPKHIDSHMSLDSLASPKKQPLARGSALPVHHDENSLSRDSLADSIRSSVRTEGTISQESLAHPVATHRHHRLSVESRVTAKNLRNSQKTMNGGGGSTSGSTSSVGTAAQKANRLMRNFSDTGVVFRNPGNAAKGLSSNSNSSNSSARTSFLSKKSKEILERRSLMESQRVKGAKDDKSTAEFNEGMRRSLPINKSSSTSNIPTTRRIFNTTLHLRKSAVIPERPDRATTSVGSNGAMSGSREKRESREGLKPSRIAQKVAVVPSRHHVVKNGGGEEADRKSSEKSARDVMSTEKAFEVLRLNNCDDSVEDVMGGFDSKMVRSSTFSKDCPDLSQSIEIS